MKCTSTAISRRPLPPPEDSTCGERDCPHCGGYWPCHLVWPPWRAAWWTAWRWFPLPEMVLALLWDVL